MHADGDHSWQNLENPWQLTKLESAKLSNIIPFDALFSISIVFKQRVISLYGCLSEPLSLTKLSLQQMKLAFTMLLSSFAPSM